MNNNTSRSHLQSLFNNSLAIRQEIQRFESVHPSIYAIYHLIDLLDDSQVASQIRDHVVCIEEIRKLTCSTYYSKIKPSDFVCNLPPSIDFKSTNKTCATIGTQYEIGFTVNNTEFIPYYSVCYNNKDCSVIYTNHRLWRGYFNKLVEIPPIGGSAIASFSCDINYNELYQLSNQQSNPRINATSAQYLQTGHLFPDRDAAVYSWKLATYSYGNFAPKWKSINSNGNWHKLENMVSEMATHRSIPFNIFDGVLYDPIPENKIYLNQTGTKIEVPQWFYKAVINRNDNPVEGYPIVEEDIIFFVYNDPYNFQTTKFCRRSQCKDYFWVFEYNQVKGNIHCCLYKDLHEGTLPEEVMKAFGTKSKGLYFSKRPGNG